MCIDDGLEQNCGISIANALELIYWSDLALDCGNSIVNALELPQSCTEYIDDLSARMRWLHC